ncbi:MAG: hypothetical protein O9353_06960 [Bacteroidia bacterium]|nr:hypothetical protein [Bacteroidia bacterium]
MKNYFILIFAILLFYNCQNTIDQSSEDICKGPIRSIYIYPSKTDSATYTKINFYCSGDTCSKYFFKNGALKYSALWFQSGEKSQEETIIESAIIPYNGKDSAVIAFIEHIGTTRHWNKDGVLIYETNLLPGRKEQRIKRDSIGNVLSIDTISY